MKKTSIQKMCLFPDDPFAAMVNRRQFLLSGASLVAHASAASLLANYSGKAIGASPTSFPPKRRLVWINLRGGWDILETVDPKPASTSGIQMSYSWGEANAVASASDGARIGRWLPRIAAIGSDMLLVRGVAMGTTSHTAGSVFMETGVLSNTGRVNAASIPTIVASESGATIPIIQLDGGSDAMTDRGLLKTVSVVRASNLQLYQRMYPQNSQEKDARLALLDYLKSSISKAENLSGKNDRLGELATAESKIRGQFIGDVGGTLQLSDADLATFGSERSRGMQGGGGVNTFALALKLLKNEVVTCVNLGFGGFDTHANQAARLQPVLAELDFLVSTLVDQLRAAGQLDSTLIVLYSDFGRTPKLNGSNGRDHWPVGGAIMIGGGLDGGRAVGATDDNLLAQNVDLATGSVSSSGTQLSPTHVGGSVLALTLGPEYLEYRPYLSAPACLTRLKKAS